MTFSSGSDGRDMGGCLRLTMSAIAFASTSYTRRRMPSVLDGTQSAQGSEFPRMRGFLFGFDQALRALVMRSINVLVFGHQGSDPLQRSEGLMLQTHTGIAFSPA